MPSVMSVLGPLNADELGLTLPHEHLFVDIRCYCPPEPQDGALRDFYRQPVAISNRAWVVNHPWEFRDNPILDDLDSAVQEASAFAALGGATIIDLTSSCSMGRNPQGLRLVAERTGVNVIMASGRYTFPSLTESEKQMSVEDIEVRVLDEFNNGVEGGIRPGLLKAGFVTAIDKEPEIRTLRAVGRVQAKVGCALAVHPHIWQPDSHRILDILEEEGCDLRRVILCHQDFLGDRADYLDSLCKRGAFIEFDTFGSGWINDQMWQQTDEIRIGFLKKQIELGNQQHLLISGDMCLKLMLAKWGGIGYVNIPRLVIPAMKAASFSAEMIRMITVENPARVFCH
jgi:phosphotriesterase-related protein